MRYKNSLILSMSFTIKSSEQVIYVIMSLAFLDFATQNRKERLAKNLFGSNEILR